MVQHAVDVNELENKLQKQEDAMNKLGNPVDITNLLNKVKEQQDDIMKLKVQHAVEATENHRQAGEEIYRGYERYEGKAQGRNGKIGKESC